MNAAAISSFPAILLDLAFASLLLGIGFTGGWFVSRKRHEEQADEPTGVDTERAQAALARIRDLASSVAHDVGQHNTRVQEITTDFNDACNGGNEPLDKVVLDTVAKMMKANEQLQSRLASAEEKLQQQAEEIEHHAADARTDALTRLANRRAFDDELERRYNEWKRLRVPYTLLMADVDHFKKFNDTHGHQAGDEVLRGVAKVLKGAVREMDVVCRYGGEEFAVVMPATEGDTARQVAERARKAVEGSTFKFEGRDLKVTTSVGMAEILVGEGNELLVRRADEALYASKSAGRNRTFFHDGHNTQSVTDAPAKVVPPKEETVPTPTLDTLPDTATFNSEVQRRVSEGQRFQVRLSLIEVAVEDFKGITAKNGVEVGKLVMETVAQYLQLLLRDMDLLGFYGSGKFAIMLPGSSLADASLVADRIRRTISACVVPLRGDKKLPIALSQGLAEALPGDDYRTLLKRADDALKSAAEAGSNNAFLHNGQGCRPVVVATEQQAVAR